MKELSIEEKAKAYDEALKVIKGCNPDENGFITIYPQEIFPELKVSDDERICNGLIKLLNCIAAIEYENTIGITKEEALEWVKKQGEQKPTDKVEPKFNVGIWVVNKLGDVWHIDSFDKKNYQVSDGKGNYIFFPIKKQDEMHLWTIQDAKGGDVLSSEDKDKVFLYNGKFDLRGRVCAYCGIYKTYDGLRFTECAIGNYFTYKEPYPATKEQRDLLFQKMKEAGYEWDAEKKELKKLEQKPIACSDGTIDNSLEGIIDAAIYWGKEAPTENGRIPEDKMKGAVDYYCSLIRNNDGWSEEDEDFFNDTIAFLEDARDCRQNALDCIDWLKSLKERVLPQPKQEWSVKDLTRFNDIIRIIEGSDNVASIKKHYVDFLKSIMQRSIPQNRWKPSDIQLECLSDAIKHYNLLGYSASKLQELLDDLKKLRE